MNKMRKGNIPGEYLDCSNFEKSFSKHGDLEIFSKMHIGEKPYQCSQCGNSFSSNEDLENCTKIHRGETPF